MTNTKYLLPKISIITVCFNSKSDLEKTILSVKNLTYPNFEFIVIDGGSTDGTSLVLQKYKNLITQCVSESDSGIYDAMNKGVNLSKGEWACFMNAGDVFAGPDVLSSVFNSPIEKEIGVIYGDVILNFPNLGLVLKRKNEVTFEQQPFNICHQASFTKLDLLKKYPYDLSFKIYADVNFFYTVWKKGIPFKYLPIKIAKFEALNGVSSSQIMSCFRELTRVKQLYWYNSFYWWRHLIKSLLKKAYASILPSNIECRRRYERVKRKYEAYED